MSTINEKDIDKILERGVENFIDPDNSFKKKLIKKAKGEYGDDIIIKFGIDPTHPDLHLGHAVVLQKLRQFQNIGCKIIFLVGDFTASIGDPTGKNKTRPDIEQKEIEKNMKTYLEQVGKILLIDKKLFSWIRNSDWFISPFDLNLPKDYKISLNIKKDNKEFHIPINPQSIEGKAIAFRESRMQKKDLHKEKIESVSIINLLWVLKHITFGRLLQRSMFQERIKKGEELHMHEILYPVFQGIDSDVISKIYGSCDLEIGGTDQFFNMLVGRDIMSVGKKEPQSVMSVQILEGTDGKEKMGKSLDNYIEITGEANDMYGKIMSIPDSLITRYFKLSTFTSYEEINDIQKRLDKDNKNARDIKMRLAKEITSIYHGEKKANNAQDSFVNVFQKGEMPDDTVSISINSGVKIGDILKKEGFAKSSTTLKRLFEDGAIKDFDSGEKIKTPDFLIEKSINIKVGKKRFLKINVK